MKYKVLSIAMILIMLVTAYAAQNMEVKTNRYHQHIEAQPKQPCTDHGDEVFCTHLPIISIMTGGPMPLPYILDEDREVAYDEVDMLDKNYETVSATIQYFDQELTNNHLIDSPIIEEKGLTRTRGSSSRAFDKKGYALKFKEANLIDNKDVALAGMTADSDWVLNGPFLDKTLIRNYLCYNISGEIMDYAPNVRFCELFLNGDYMGVYLIVEKIGYNDEGRINMTQTDEGVAETSYIIVADRGTDDPLYALNTFGTYSQRTMPKDANNAQLEIIYPSKTLTEEQKRYIEKDISAFEKALFSFDYDDPRIGYRRYIDVQSFVDYFLIQEFTLNYDSMGLSTYLYKDVRGKLNLCVWDFNSAFDYYQYSSTSPHTFLTQQKLWYKYMFKDEYFVEAVIGRYHQLRETFFNEEYLLNYIDETVAYLGEAINRNYAVWGYTFEESEVYDFLYPTERNPRTYEEAIDQLKHTIIERGEYMDQNINQLYRYCHDSINKKYNH